MDIVELWIAQVRMRAPDYLLHTNMNTITVLENIFPCSDIGAPCPMVLANEHIVHLGYYTPDDKVAVVVFNHCFSFKMSMPDENTISRHPLALRGLLAYASHLVEKSRWITELEARYKVISNFSRDGRVYQHYIFTFHDRTFECISSGYSVHLIENLSVTDALIELKKQHS